MNPTGPRTEEGKQRSSMNSYKHGLTGKTLILTPEEKALYDQHVQSYFDLYKPVGHPETVLVECIAGDYWRALRARAQETSLLCPAVDGAPDETSGPANAWLQNQKALSNLTLYIQRIERSIKNNTQALEVMQEQRKEAQRQAEKEVKILARAAWASGNSYDPAADFPPGRGFVFSESQVQALVRREDRLEDARNWQICGFHPDWKPRNHVYGDLKAA